MNGLERLLIILMYIGIVTGLLAMGLVISNITSVVYPI
jgi:hypothetical protein